VKIPRTVSLPLTSAPPASAPITLPTPPTTTTIKASTMYELPIVGETLLSGATTASATSATRVPSAKCEVRRYSILAVTRFEISLRTPCFRGPERNVGNSATDSRSSFI